MTSLAGLSLGTQEVMPSGVRNQVTELCARSSPQELLNGVRWKTHPLVVGTGSPGRGLGTGVRAHTTLLLGESRGQGEDCWHRVRLQWEGTFLLFSTFEDLCTQEADLRKHYLPTQLWLHLKHRWCSWNVYSVPGTALNSLCTISFDSLNNCMMCVLLLHPFQKWENWGLVKLNIC